MAELQRMKVADLKIMLRDRGLSVVGMKADLIDRLLSAEAVSDPVIDEDALLEEVDDTPACVDGDEEIEKLEASILDVKVPELKVDEVSKNEEESQLVQPQKEDIPVEQRLVERAKRFGVQSDSVKKLARATRFGVITAPSTTDITKSGGNTPLTGSDVEKMRKRSDRFGASVSTVMANASDNEKLLKRKARFGATSDPISSKIKLSTHADPEVTEKLDKRAQRFGVKPIAITY